MRFFVFAALTGSLCYSCFASGRPLDNWEPQTSGTKAPFSDVAFGNGVWVAVSGFFDAPAVILVSSNGSSWVNPHVSLSVAPYQLIFTNGLFVGGGKDGTMLISANGYDWLERPSGFSSGILAVTYFKGSYVALSQRSGVAISQDGQTWVITLAEFGDLAAHDIQADDNAIVFAGAYGTIGISTNATTWELFYDRPLLNQIVPFRGGWVGDYFGQIWTTPSPVQWENVSSVTSPLWTLITYGNVIIGTSSDGKIYSSQDGVKWESHSTPSTAILRGIAFGNGQFVAVGYNGTILTSKLNSPAQLGVVPPPKKIKPAHH